MVFIRRYRYSERLVHRTISVARPLSHHTIQKILTAYNLISEYGLAYSNPVQIISHFAAFNIFFRFSVVLWKYYCLMLRVRPMRGKYINRNI